MCITGVLLAGDLLAPTLNFLAELSQDTMMKDWLGQADNCAFWAVLLRALCANGSANMFATSSNQVVQLFTHRSIECMVYFLGSKKWLPSGFLFISVSVQNRQSLKEIEPN